MVINEVRLQRFMGHKDTAIQFSLPVALFLGSNEAGKSTVADAVRWALDETYLHPISGQPIKKQDHGILIQHGEKKAEVTMSPVPKAVASPGESVG